MHVRMQYRIVAADAFSTQRQFLWDLCYRVTGTVADADAVLRECFAKAVERPLVERDADWRPHLLRSAASLAMEALRQRKRRQYVGSWLPAPIDTGHAASPGPRGHAANGARYDLVESGSMAFLKALEELEPRERVIFVLSDALGFDIQDAAAVLRFTSMTSRTLLQNARRRMQRYESTVAEPTIETQTEVGAILRECVTDLQSYDAAKLEKILDLDAQAMFDSAGEFVAPPGTVFGSATIAKLLTRFAGGIGAASFAFRMLNGLPAALALAKGRPRWARRFVLRVEARDGLISEVHVIMATAKLAAVRFDSV
jgi:RNA polymerase sigma-70 factor (ECF subfamily)